MHVRAETALTLTGPSGGVWTFPRPGVLPNKGCGNLKCSLNKVTTAWNAAGESWKPRFLQELVVMAWSKLHFVHRELIVSSFKNSPGDWYCSRKLAQEARLCENFLLQLSGRDIYLIDLHSEELDCDWFPRIEEFSKKLNQFNGSPLTANDHNHRLLIKQV